MASNTELAWAAGFFDGEGCTTYDKRTATALYLKVSVSQCGTYSLERFKAVLGMGSISGPHQPKSPDGYVRSPRWNWYSSRHREVLALLWPYLGPDKRLQALEKWNEQATYNKENECQQDG